MGPEGPPGDNSRVRTAGTTGQERDGRPSLARDSGRAVVGSVVSNAANVLVILVIARFLGGEAVGQYTIVFALRAILLLVCGLGMRTAMTRFVAAYLAHAQHDTVRGSIRAGVLVPLALATTVATAWFALAGPLATHVFGQPELRLPMQLFAASLPFFVLTDNALAATQGFQTMRAYVWVGQVLDPVLRLGLTVLVLVAGFGVDATAVALLVSSVLASLAAAVALFRMVARLPGEGRETPTRELASFSAMSWVASMATQGLLWADVVILGVLVSAEEVGYYQVAARVVLIGMFVITPLTASMAPRIAWAWAHADRELVTSRYVGIVLWSARLSFPLLAGLLAVPVAVLQLFGDGFGAASGVVLLLVGGAVAEAVGAPSSVLLNQIGRNRLNMVVNLSALTLNISLNLLLIPVYGIEGSAFAWAVTMVAGAVVRIVVVRRVATDRWPWSRQLGVCAAAAAVAWAVASGVTRTLPEGAGVQILLAVPLVALVYAAALLAWGLDRGERDLVSRELTLRWPGLRRWRVQRRLRHAARSAERLSLDRLISPFRFDVLARADLFRLAREESALRHDDPEAFALLVRASRYGEWFEQVLVANGYVAGGERAQERTFRSIVSASLQLMDRHDRVGREALGRVSVARVPAGTSLGGWALGEDRWVLVDGGHRVALALLAGETHLGPGDYVVEDDVLPPNNTVAFLDSARTSEQEVLTFLARGLVAPAQRRKVTSWAALLKHLEVEANRDAVRHWPHSAPSPEVSPSAGRTGP